MATPTPSPSPVLIIVTDPSPWDWSLGSVIAVLGAIATVAIAALALAQTRRANHLEAEARNRADAERQHQHRHRLVTVIDRYLTARLRGLAQDEHKAMHDTAVEEGFSFHAPQVEWAEREAEEVRILYDWVPRDANGSPTSQGPWEAYLTRHGEVRMRLFGWVETGEFDASPLPSTAGAPEIGPDGQPYVNEVKP